MKILDIENWKRKEHFKLFSSLRSPYFGITTNLDCTETYYYSKSNKISLFGLYLHKSMVAANSVEELKYRIKDNQIVIYDTIHAGSTIAREDETFGFAYINYSKDFNVFNKSLQDEVYQVQNSSGLRLKNEDLDVDLIRHTTIPWFSFTSILHPTNLDPSESIPKVTFGKIYSENDRYYLPVSIEAHHGLLDGIHLAKYFTAFQELLNNPEL